MKTNEFISEDHARRILEEVKDLRDYKSGGRWRSALSDNPKRLTLHGSKTRSTSRRWTPAVEELKRILEEETGRTFNFALINHYDNGKDGIAFHSDNLRNSVHGTIASVSLGATRTFRVRHKLTGDVTDVELEHRDLFVFDEEWNAAHWHGIPPQKGAGYRCNLTFRCVSESMVRGPPAKLFAVPKSECDAIIREYGIKFVAPKDLRAGDVALKRWGNAGSLKVLKTRDEISDFQKNGRMEKGPFGLSDLFIRCDNKTRKRIQTIVCPMMKHYFPTGPMLTPISVTISQICGILRDGFMRCGYPVVDATPLAEPIPISAYGASPFIKDALDGMRGLKLHYPFSRYLLGGSPGFERYPRKTIETRTHIKFNLCGQTFAIVETQGNTKFGKKTIGGKGARIIGTVTFADKRILYGVQEHLDADASRHLLDEKIQVMGFEYDEEACAFTKTE